MSRPASRTEHSASLHARRASTSNQSTKGASSSISTTPAPNPTLKKRKLSNQLLQPATSLPPPTGRSTPNPLQSRARQSEPSLKSNISTVTVSVPPQENGTDIAGLHDDDDDDIEMLSMSTSTKPTAKSNSSHLKHSEGSRKAFASVDDIRMPAKGSSAANSASRPRGFSASNAGPANQAQFSHQPDRSEVQAPLKPAFLPVPPLSKRPTSVQPPPPKSLLPGPPLSKPATSVPPPPKSLLPGPPLSKPATSVPPPPKSLLPGPPLSKPATSMSTAVTPFSPSLKLDKQKTAYLQSTGTSSSPAVNTNTSSTSATAVDTLSAQLHEIQKSLVDLEKNQKMLLEDTKLIKSTLEKLTSTPASMPSDATWIEFAIAVIYELCEVPHGSPPSSLENPVSTGNQALRPRWDQGPRSNVNKMWRSTFKKAFFNSEASFTQDWAITIEQRKNVSELAVEQYRVHAFNSLRTDMGYGRQQKSKSSGLVAQDADDGDVSDDAPESEDGNGGQDGQDGVDILATRRLTLATLRRASCEDDGHWSPLMPTRIMASAFDEGTQSDSLSPSDDERPFVIRRPVWGSRRYLHFKSIVDGLVQARLSKRGDPPLSREFTDDWTLDCAALVQSSDIQRWMVSRAWIAANREVAAAVVVQEQESDREARSYLDHLLAANGYISDGDESVAEYSIRVEMAPPQE